MWVRLFPARWKCSGNKQLWGFFACLFVFGWLGFLVWWFGFFQSFFIKYALVHYSRLLIGFILISTFVNLILMSVTMAKLCFWELAIQMFKATNYSLSNSNRKRDNVFYHAFHRQQTESATVVYSVKKSAH